MNKKSIQKSSNSQNNENSKYTYSNKEALVKTNIFGVGITNATAQEVLEYLVNVLQKTKKNLYVVTPNPEILLLSQKNPDLKRAINHADLALCDGMQLFRGAQILGRPLKERIIGTDFVEKVCEKVEDWPITVGFLGGGPHVAEKAAECLTAKYPRLKIVFVSAEWPEDEVVLRSENRGSTFYSPPSIIQPTDILFVAFGAPKQELWMTEHIDKIPVRVMIGVGGALDQIADPSLRPPAFLHRAGLGFLYRLIRQPWRIRRQSKLGEFVWLVLKAKLSRRRS